MPSPVRLADFEAAQAEIRELSARLSADRSREQAVATIPQILAHPCCGHSSADVLELMGELAHCLVDLECYDEAIAAWEAAIGAGFAAAPHPRANIAEALVLSGQVAEGDELFEELRLQCPSDVWLCNTAGIAHLLIDDNATALSWFEDAITLSVEHGDADRILDQLVEMAATARLGLGAPPNSDLDDLVAGMEVAPATAGLTWRENDPEAGAPDDGCVRCGYKVGCDAPVGLPSTETRGPDWGGGLAVPTEDLSLVIDSPESDPFGLVDMMFGSGEPAFGEDLSSDPVPSASAAKVGRNDPCDCGSGRKSKRCCHST